MARLTTLMPDKPEVWYDLAAIQATIGIQADATNNKAEASQKYGESITSLSRAIQLNNQRLATDAKAKNLVTNAQQDPRFMVLRQLPAFQQLVAPK